MLQKLRSGIPKNRSHVSNSALFQRFAGCRLVREPSHALRHSARFLKYESIDPLVRSRCCLHYLTRIAFNIARVRANAQWLRKASRQLPWSNPLGILIARMPVEISEARIFFVDYLADTLERFQTSDSLIRIKESARQSARPSLPVPERIKPRPAGRSARRP